MLLGIIQGELKVPIKHLIQSFTSFDRHNFSMFIVSIFFQIFLVTYRTFPRTLPFTFPHSLYFSPSQKQLQPQVNFAFSITLYQLIVSTRILYMESFSVLPTPPVSLPLPVIWLIFKQSNDFQIVPYCYLFIHSPVDRYWGCFYFWLTKLL